MPRRPEFRIRRDERGRWIVEVPSTLSATGKRQRAYHTSRDKARDHLEGLRAAFLAHGTAAAGILPSTAADAARALEILAGTGITLTEAARLAAATVAKEKASETVANAVAAFLKASEGLRPVTRDSYKATCRRLTAAFGDRLMATITPAEIATAGWKNESGASAAGSYRNVRVFWRWSAKRGWCSLEVLAAVVTPRAPRDGEIGVLTPSEAEALLRVAEDRFPNAVGHFALALFAGVRAEEIEKLAADHVSPTGIDIPAAVAKKGRRRYITPNATLAAWLEAHPFQPFPEWRKVFKRARRMAGWQVEVSQCPDAPPATRGSWKQNAMRHSHASYAIANGEPLERLLFEFGHVGTPELLRQHYVGRVSKSAAAEYFAIKPQGDRGCA